MAFAPLLAPALAIIGTGVSAYGQYQAMSQEEDMQKYNASLRESEAKQKQLETRESVKRQRTENDRFKSSQRAAFAKAGITSTGTPLEVMSQTAADLELSVLDTAYAGESQRRSLMQQASVNRMGASATGRAKPLAVGATVLGGANSLARMKL